MRNPLRSSLDGPLRGPLGSSNFRRLVTCNVISIAGSAVSFVALPFAVLRIGGSANDIGYVATAGLIPLLAFLLLGGVIADRLPRHQVIVAANTLQACAQGAAAALVITGEARVWQLAVLAAARSIGFGFYYPAAQGLLPQTVPADQRAQANALDRTGRNVADIGGAALGGLLVGLAGPGWCLAIDAASFAVAAFLRLGMRFPSPAPAPAATPPASAPSAPAPPEPVPTTLQQEIPREKLSRVSSYDALGNYALAPIGTAVAGPLASALGTQAVLAAGGVLVVLFPLLVLLVPEVRHMRRN